MLKAKLVVVGGDAKSKEVALRLPCIIGRGRDATLTLPHPLVSRQHTEIVERDGRLYVRDMGSLNGTFLNNKRLEKEEALEPNQLLTLGNVTFRAVYEMNGSNHNESSPVAAAADNGSKTVEVDEPVQFEPIETEAVEMLDKETVYDDEKSSESSDTDKSLLGGVDSILGSDSEIEEKVVAEEAQPVADAVLEPIAKSEAASVGVSGSIEETPLETSGKVPAPSSDVFELDGVEATPAASVVDFSLDGVPDSPAAMSFAGGIDLGGDTQPDASKIDSVEIDLGDVANDKPAPESGLDSFFNNLPR